MFILELIIGVLVAGILIMGLYIHKLRRNTIPHGNMWGTILFNKDLCIASTINLKSVTTLRHTIKSIEGVNIRNLYEYVIDEEKSVAQNIAGEIEKVASGNGEPVHFEYVVKTPEGVLNSVMCLAEKLPDGKILCHIVRAVVKDIISKKSFVNRILYEGVKNIPLGICIRHYEPDGAGRYIFRNDRIKNIFEKVDADRSSWNLQKETEEDDRVAKNGCVNNVLRHFILKNGKSLYLNVNKQRFIDENKQIFVFVTMVDCTINVEKQHEIENLYNNLELAVDAGQLSAWSYNVKEQMSYTLYGNTLSHKGISYRDMISQLHEDDRKLFHDTFNILLSGQEERMTIRFRTLDPVVGQFRNIESKMISRRTMQGQLIYINGIQRDVTVELARQKQQADICQCLDRSLQKNGITLWFYSIKLRRNIIVLGDKRGADGVVPDGLGSSTKKSVSDEYSIKLQQVLKGELGGFEYSNVDFLGNAYEYVVSLRCDDNGNPDYVFGTCCNVSHLSTGKELLDENAKLKAVVNSLPVAFELFDNNGVLVDLNQRAVEVFGLPSREYALGCNLIMAKDQAYSDDIVQNLQNGLPGSFFIDYDFDYVKRLKIYESIRSGIVRMEVWASAVISGDGQRMGTAVLVSDVANCSESGKNIMQLFFRNSSIINGLAVGLELYDRNGKLLESNLFDRGLFSGPAAKKPGYDFRNDPYFTPQMVEKVETLDRVKFIIDYINSEKKKLHLSYNITSLRDANNKPDGYMFIISDVTEYNAKLNKAAKDLDELNRVNKVLLENVQVGLAYLDNDYRVIWENIDSYMPNNAEADKFVMGSLCYKVKGFSSPCEDCLMKRSLETGNVEIIESEIGGVPVELMARPIVDAQGNRCATLIRFIDIQERKRAMQVLNSAKQKAEEADRLKSTFLANMSHEIRTPLNSIVGFSDLIRSTDDKRVIEECSRIIDTNSEILINLINNILDLSKIEAGIIDINMSRFNVTKLFSELATSFGIQANDGVKIICDIPIAQYDIVADKTRLTQVVSNFMSNAVKFTEKGFITLKLDLKEAGVLVSVTDTGIGISQENIEKVFDRFQKLNAKIQGTGLGLSICRSIVKSLEGTVGAESVIGSGSRFWAYIPCEVIGCTEPTSEPVVVNDVRFKRVLVVEDDDSNFMLVSMMLENDFDVERAITGEEAVEKVRSNCPDVVLMDIKMPVLDGVEATKKIRGFNASVPIVALTAYAFDVDRERALKAGCNAFLTKPLKRKDLFDVLSGL